jgi:hypothetical protein
MIDDETITYFTLKYGLPQIVNGYDLEIIIRDNEIVEITLHAYSVKDDTEYRIDYTDNLYEDSYEFVYNGCEHYVAHEYFPAEETFVIVFDKDYVRSEFGNCLIIINFSQNVFNLIQPLLKRMPDVPRH